MHQRFFGAVRDPKRLWINFLNRLAQFVPVGVVRDDQRQLDAALFRTLAHRHPTARAADQRVRQAPRPFIGQRRRRSQHHLPRHLRLCRCRRIARFAQFNAEPLIEIGEFAQRAVQVDRRVPTRATKLRNEPLAFPERVYAHSMRPFGEGGKRGEELPNLFFGRRMTKNRKAECGFGYKKIARHWLKWFASWVKAPLVIARNDGSNGLPAELCFDHHLCGSKDVSRGNEADLYTFYANIVVIAYFLNLRETIRAVSSPCDFNRVGSSQQGLMTGTTMIAMRMRDDGAGHWPHRIDVKFA